MTDGVERSAHEPPCPSIHSTDDATHTHVHPVGRILSQLIEQAYYILDELFIGGQLQETSKNEVLRVRLGVD